MPELHVLRVFCAEDGTGGNRLGVFLDAAEVPADGRQQVAHELGYAETVFVDDRERGELRIYTPEVELPLAGHPLVGVAWLLRERERAPAALRPPAGECPVRFERELAFVAARPEWAPAFELVELDSPQEVERLERPPGGMVDAWSWIDEAAGRVRARVFAAAAGIAEDEATGAAAILLCAALERTLEVRQGPTAGSLIYARGVGDGMVEVGGRVMLDDVREHPLRGGG